MGGRAATANPAALTPPSTGLHAPGTAGLRGSQSNPAPAATTTTNTNAAAATPLPPPPPPSLTQPPADRGVPPTPAPATPGLPAPSSVTRALPSSTGLGSEINNELRPSASLSTAQVADIQASLAAGGLYRGPIDGVLSGATRAAVREFQSIDRLPPTGLLDGETLSRITTGKSASTPLNSTSATLGSGVGSAGTTSTAGNASTVDPFTTGPTPFPLSAPLNMSPAAPAGTTIQP